MDKLVQIVFMARAEIDESLHGLVGVGGKVLALRRLDDSDRIGDEDGEVGDAVVDVCGFVDADERLVEDLEEIAEEL